MRAAVVVVDTVVVVCPAGAVITAAVFPAAARHRMVHFGADHLPDLQQADQVSVTAVVVIDRALGQTDLIVGIT
jgi:hypothetical protein